MHIQKLFQPIIISEYHLLPSRIEVEDDLIDIFFTIGFLTVNDISQNSFSSKARVRGGLGLNFSWCDDEIKDIMTNPGLSKDLFRYGQNTQIVHYKAAHHGPGSPKM